MSRTASAVVLLLALLALVALPAFASATVMNAFIKMMIAALFALSFALAMGQAGMLSFGHAAYYGLGAFASLHLMRAVELHVFWFPTPLVPLAGAAAGALSGLVFGWLATQRVGVYFAMLTFALSELLVSVAPGLNTVFGAESGISTMRSPAWGLSFGPDSHVYYLTLIWFVISAWCMWALHQDPARPSGAGAARQRASRALPRLRHAAVAHLDLHDLLHLRRRRGRRCSRWPTSRPTTRCSRRRCPPTSCCRPSSAARAPSSDRRSVPR